MCSSAELRRGQVDRTIEDVKKLRKIIDAEIDATKRVNYQMLNSTSSEQLEELLKEVTGERKQLEHLEKILADRIEAIQKTE